MLAMSAAILLALLFFASPLVVFAQDPGCGELNGGLLKDCGFVDFYGDEGAGSGVWKIFKLSGNPGIALHPTDAWPKGPSVWVKGRAPFDGGIYQQVHVTPGKGYHFTLPYAVVNLDGKGWSEDNQVNRRLGIDPFGGTDANSPNVKWSADYFGKAKVTESIDFDEYARADTITAFIRVTNPYTDKNVDVFIDTPALYENTGMAPIEVSAPTVTPPPPPPTLVPPTAKPTLEPQPTDAPTDQTTPTEPPPPPTDAPVVEPTATVSEATRAPRATRAQVARVESTVRPARTRVASSSSSPSTGDTLPPASPFELGTVGLIGLVGISGAILLVSAAAVLLLRRK